MWYLTYSQLSWRNKNIVILLLLYNEKIRAFLNFKKRNFKQRAKNSKLPEFLRKNISFAIPPPPPLGQYRVGAPRVSHCLRFIYTERKRTLRSFLPSATKLRRLCFYRCLSVHGGGGTWSRGCLVWGGAWFGGMPGAGGVPAPGGCMSWGGAWSWGVGIQACTEADSPPPERWLLLLRTVHSLLECILVYFNLCGCSMWTLHWILFFEPTRKRYRFRFRTNINEPLHWMVCIYLWLDRRWLRVELCNSESSPSELRSNTNNIEIPYSSVRKNTTKYYKI